MRFLVDERDVLGPILREVPEFVRFYNEEREKRIGFIRWFRDFEISDGYSAYASYLKCAIYYGKSPISFKDAHVMAHEIMHLIRYQENDLLDLSYQKEARDLVQKLLEMLEDPIIDLFLYKNYNFDIRSTYLSDIDFCRKNIGKEAEDGLSKLINGVDLAKTILRWDLIDQSLRGSWYSYLDWYKVLRPVSFQIGKEIADIVRVHGPQTIERQEKIIEIIINRYNLKDIISILY